MTLREALISLGAQHPAGFATVLSRRNAAAIIELAEAGRRNSKTDISRLDAAIQSLIDLRYDDEDTRSKARKSLDDLLAQLQEPEEEESVAEAASEPLEGTPVITEAAANGSTWDVLLIQPGLSKNRRNYRPEVLKEAVGLFEGTRSFAPDGGDHFGSGPHGRSRGPKELVGWFTNARYVDGVALPSGKKASGVAATYHVSEAAEWLRTMLRDSWERGKPDLVGFSIVGDGKVKVLREATTGKTYADVEHIDAIESVDPVVNAAAGGMTIRLVASKEGAVDWEKMTLAEAVSGLVSGAILPDDLKEHRSDLFEALEAGKVGTPAPAPAPAPEPSVAPLIEAEFAKMRTAQEVELELGRRKGLPEGTKDRIRASTKGKVLDATGISEAIKAETDYLASLNVPVLTDAGPIIEGGQSEQEKVTEHIYDILASKSNDSIKDVYIDLTGDRSMSGKLAEGGRLTESITSTTFGEIMGDSITRRMLDYYNLPGLDNWRSIASVNPIRDFRTNRRIRFGGYGNLPAVAQAGPYTALASPTDEEATFAITKRGGTEDMTLEAIANDDLAQLRDIPRRLGRAAAQTLHEFVWDFIRTNAVIYDTTALAVAGHNNTGVAALAAASLAAGRLAMLKQTEMDNAKRLSIPPRYLVVPPDLEQTAYELTQTDREVGNANNTLNFARTFGLTTIVVPYWTDVNNWWLVASPSDVPTIEVGFFNGNESPELFVQDQPTNGANFTNDKVTYKIWHIYGGAVLDFRGFYGAIVP